MSIEEGFTLHLAALLGCDSIFVTGELQDNGLPLEWKTIHFQRNCTRLDVKVIRAVDSFLDAVDGHSKKGLPSCQSIDLAPPKENAIADSRAKLEGTSLPQLLHSIEAKSALVRELIRQPHENPSMDVHPERCPFNLRYFEEENGSWVTSAIGRACWQKYACQWASLGALEEQKAWHLHENLLLEVENLLSEARDICADALTRLRNTQERPTP
jgi:hypothetical protein